MRVTTDHQMSSYRNPESKISYSEGVYLQILLSWSKNHTKKFLRFLVTYSVGVIKHYGKEI